MNCDGSGKLFVGRGETLNKGWLYDASLWPLEVALLRRWRSWLWSGVVGPRVLELGSGTGLNFPYHPEDIAVTALERDRGYLERSRERRARDGSDVTLVLGSVEDLPFPDAVFDEVVASFILCSVQSPGEALREVNRVLKPGGRLHLLEHCRPAGFLGKLFDRVAPWIHETFGDRIDGEPIPLLEREGFRVLSVTQSLRWTLRLLIARKRERSPTKDMDTSPAKAIATGEDRPCEGWRCLEK